MSTLERILRDYDATSAVQPASWGSATHRRDAAQQLSEWGLPTTREENWRYTNLRALGELASFRPAAADLAVPRNLPPPVEGFARLVYVNGHLHADRSTSTRDGADLPLAPGATSDIDAGTLLPPGRDQRLGLLGELFATDRAALRIRGHAAIEVLFINTDAAGGGAVYPQLHVQLDPNSHLALIERHLGTQAQTAPGPTALVCAHTSVRVGRGANLRHYRLQQCGDRTLFFASLSAALADDAAYAMRAINVGGSSSRSSNVVQLAGRSAALSWHELAVGQQDQVHDTYLKVEHLQPATRTEETFRGIGTDRARIGFSGHIHIDALAPGSDANQSLRGLVDGPRAEVDLRPRLQINTDEVRAKHGATVGRLDDNLLFYLLSRGLERGTARALLKWAFLGDVLKHVDIPGLRHAAEQAAAGSLSDLVAAGAVSAGGLS